MNAEQHLDSYDSLATACKALSHPARLAILKTLADRGSCICGEIVAVMPLSQATVSQHLKVLKDAGLIRGETDGPKSCYSIDRDEMRTLGDRISKLFGALENCCQR